MGRKLKAAGLATWMGLAALSMMAAACGSEGYVYDAQEGQPTRGSGGTSGDERTGGGAFGTSGFIGGHGGGGEAPGWEGRLPPGGSESAEAAVYPDPPPDFSHPGTPHEALFSPTGGTVDRPMLVIYVHFSDTPERPGENVAWTRGRFLDSAYPSVAQWHEVNSFGNLALFPATETSGTANDGVVVVNAGPIGPYIDKTIPYETRNRTALALADPFVNFAVFDSNGDGKLDDTELIVVNLRVARGGMVDGINGPACTSGPACGPDIGEVANRGVTAGAPLDGKTIALRVAMGATAANFSTWVHEIMHTTVHMVDLYAFPIGHLDIAGDTLGLPDTDIYSASAWSKVHWGWIKPTVVTKDGYYSVPLAYTMGASFILYDPDRGTDDYFIVENRKRIPGSYDKDATDNGLVVWRIDEKKFNPPSGSSGPEGGPIATRQPNGLQVAWDPSDSQSPQRTMTSVWRDGTSSKLAVRAIGPATDAMRAYFDVRGPGVLVDTFPLGVGGRPEVVAGALQTIAVPVMNTGEAVDTFDFAFAGLPAGWVAAPFSAMLSPGVDETADLDLAPAHDHPVGSQTLGVIGTSATNPSVSSSCALEVKVVHVSDLAVLAMEVDGAPTDLLIGDSRTLTVRTQATNHGPSWPTDATLQGTASASAGVAITPAIWGEAIGALAKDEIRETTETFEITCAAPGAKTFTFAAEIAPATSEDSDLTAVNNTAEIAIVVECVLPVAVNIKPGSPTNPINPRSRGVVPIAVLTTAAGEYGLPVAIDATRIDAESTRFGTEGLVWAEAGGAPEAHGKGHVEHSLELDEVTIDGDPDMVLHYQTLETGILPGTSQGCVKGKLSVGGSVFKFFGCDSVRTVPP